MMKTKTSDPLSQDVMTRVVAPGPSVPLKEMLESTPVKFIYCDPDLVVRYVNPAADRALRVLGDYLGLADPALVGQSFDAFHRFSAADRFALRTGRRVHVERTVGRERVVLDAMPVRVPGGLIEAINITWKTVVE